MKGHTYDVAEGRLVEHKAHGICMFQSNCGYFCHCDEDSYCPDYCNRNRVNKQDKQTLEQWMEKMNIVIPEEEKVVKSIYDVQ